MAKRDSAPLTRGDWLDALCELSLCCADSEAWEAGDRLREMNALLRLAPIGHVLNGLRPIGIVRLEALLAADAPETAAMAMLDQGAGYLVSRSGDGQSLATVSLPGSHAEESGTGPTPALALIGALALALSACAAGCRRSLPRVRPERQPILH